jgi:hypothetical protein
MSPSNRPLMVSLSNHQGELVEASCYALPGKPRHAFGISEDAAQDAQFAFVRLGTQKQTTQTSLHGCR